MLSTMCGRFTVSDELYEIRIAVSAQLEQLFRPWKPTFNIAPSAGPGHEQLIVVSAENGQRILKLARWWFIPPRWSKPLISLPTTFNARADRIHTKSMWRSSFQSNRCLVPANGWREFKHHEGKKTQGNRILFFENWPPEPAAAAVAAGSRSSGQPLHSPQQQPLPQAVAAAASRCTHRSSSSCGTSLRGVCLPCRALFPPPQSSHGMVRLCGVMKTARKGACTRHYATKFSNTSF
jgi:hypothetical protein